MGQVWRLISLVLWLLLLAGCGAKSTSEPIFVAQLTASGAERGTADHAKQAIRLAVPEINGKSELPGRRPIAVLQPELSASDSDSLTSIAVRLITVNRAAVLLVDLDFDDCRRVSQAAKDYDVPVLASAPIPAGINDPNLFSVNISLPVKAKVLARFAVDDLKIDRVAVLLDKRVPGSAAFGEAFQKDFAVPGKRHAESRSFKSGDEFPELARHIKDSHAGAVVFVGSGELLAKLQAAVVRTAEAIPFLVAAAGDPPSGDLGRFTSQTPLYWAGVYTPDDPTAQNQEFVKKYQATFQSNPDSRAALAYDALHICAESMHRTNNISGAPVLRALSPEEEKPFDCLTGTVAFDKDRSARRAAFVLLLHNGHFTTAKRWEPDDK